MVESKKFSKEQIIQLSGIHPFRVKGIYPFGSILHGTFNENSDYDFFIVASTLNEHKEIKGFIDDSSINLHIVTPEKFKQDLKNYKMNVVEAIFNENKVLEKEKFDFKLDKNKFIGSVKFQSYESWNLAKSRIANENDIYRAKKSLFHSLRMLEFANQILLYNKIVDYHSMKECYKRIMNMQLNSWKDIKDNFYLYKIELENLIER